MSSNPEIEVAPPVVAPATPTLTTIRAATGDLHAALDAELAIGAAEPTPEIYIRHVSAMLGWVEPVERLLARAEWPSGLEIEARLHKSAALVTDLAIAGWSSEQIAAVPRCRGLPPLDTVPRRFGALYVIEGSTLGGQVLWRRSQSALSPWPLRALAGYGRDTGRLWRIFVTNLEANGAEPGFAERAARSAAVTFRTLTDWLRDAGAACRNR